MYRTFLSLRYLRARRTNWIGMLGIFIAVMALIVILSIMSGFLAESRRVLRGTLSDLVIQPIFDYPRGDGEPLVVDGGRMLEIVRAHPRVAAAALQLQWYGILTAEEREYLLTDPLARGLGAVQLVGIDLEDELTVSDLGRALSEETRDFGQRPHDPSRPFELPPRLAQAGPPRDGVLLGEQLAATWRLGLGAEIEIYTATLDPVSGELSHRASNRKFVVTGTFRTKDNETDMQRVYFDRRVLQDFLGGRPYSTCLVKLEDYARDGELVAEDLRDALAEAGLIHRPWSDGTRFFEVRTWEDFRRTLLAAIENEKTLMGIMLSLVLLVAGFTVFAILSMMVTEKRRDIGILSALGASRRGVLLLFLTIGFWEALLGATAGAIVGVWAALRIDAIEQWLSRTFGIQIFNRDVYLFDHIPSVVDPAGVALIVLGAFACTLVAAALPAWQAARLDPVDALRYE